MGKKNKITRRVSQKHWPHVRGFPTDPTPRTNLQSTPTEHPKYKIKYQSNSIFTGGTRIHQTSDLCS